MTISLKNRIYESLCILRFNGIKFFINRYIYFNDKWVVIVKDISNFEMKISGVDDQLSLININKNNFSKDMLGKDEISHYFRVQLYLDKGYHGNMLIRDGKLLGYIWYSLIGRDMKSNHPDVKYFNIDCNEPSAYTFSMYLRSSERGNNMSVYIFSSLLKLLKDKGIVKAYGVYEAKNIPALWVHRMLKCKEISRLIITQIIFYKFVKSEPIVSNSNK